MDSQKRIPGREVVREDYIILREGDRVPADAVVIFSSNLSIDESLLTGESLAVRKSEWDGKTSMTQPGGDDFTLHLLRNPGRSGSWDRQSP